MGSDIFGNTFSEGGRCCLQKPKEAVTLLEVPDDKMTLLIRCANLGGTFEKFKAEMDVQGPGR